MFWIVVSYVASCIVYTVGSWAWTLAIWLVLGAVAVTGIVLYNKSADKKAKQK